MMRPVFLEFPEVLSQGEVFWRSQDQFMLGPDLLSHRRPMASRRILTRSCCPAADGTTIGAASA